MAQKRSILIDEEPASPTKKRRNFSEEDARRAKLYEELTHEVAEVRQKAIQSLLKELQPAKWDTVQQALERLFRGLCSGRKAARLGFFVALIELLRQIYVNPSRQSFSPSIPVIIEIATKLTKPNGNVSGQERRDHLLGRITACHAFIRSSILVQPLFAPLEWLQVLDILCSLAQETQWLREECGKILYEVACDLKADAESAKIGLFILQSLDKHGLLRSPEAIAIFIAIRQRTIMAYEDFTAFGWSENDPMHEINWSLLATTMKESSGHAKQSASFAWARVICAYLQRLESGDPTLGRDVQDKAFNFWYKVIDDHLFAPAASPERKSWGFQIVAQMIEVAPKWALKFFFSVKFMKCLINQRADAEKNILFAVAEKPLIAVKNRSKADPTLIPLFLDQLLFLKDTPDLDRRTKSKLIPELLSMANEDALKDIIALFSKQLYRPRMMMYMVGDGSIEVHRAYVADLFVALVRAQPKHLQEDETKLQDWVMLLLATLAKAAHLMPREDTEWEQCPSPPFTDVARKTFNDRLAACMHTVNTKNPEAMNLLVYFVVLYIWDASELSFDPFNHVWKRGEERTDVAPLGSGKMHMRLEVDNGLRDDLRDAYATLMTVAKRMRTAWDPVISAFDLLMSLTIFHVLNGDPEAETVLSDLEMCWWKLSGQKKVESAATTVIVDILLSYLSRQSTFLRRIAEDVFKKLTPSLDEEGLQPLISILQEEESRGGQEQLFDDQADGDGLGLQPEVAESAEISSDISGVEYKNGAMREKDYPEDKEANGGSGSDDDGSGAIQSESEDEATEDGGVNEAELRKLDAVLANTLGTKNPADQADDDAESSDADMDDEQMMALEPALAKVFKEQMRITDRKKEQKEAKEFMIGFKNRVLDLLKIYFRKEHANPLPLGLILPLLDLIRTSSSQQLAAKAFNLLKFYFDTCKSKGFPVPTETEAITLVESIHNTASEGEAKIYHAACSRASLFVAKVLVTIDKDNYDRIADIYNSTLKWWYTDESATIAPLFFTEWTSWSISTRKL